MTRFLPLLSLLVGCSAELSLNEPMMAGTSASNVEADLASLVFFDVHPTSLLDEDNTFRVLPQTFGPFGNRTGSLNIGSVQLETPTTLSGTVTADVVTPQAAGAGLPTEYGPIEATVVVTRGERTVQNYSATTNELGEFGTPLIADGYEIFVVPDNPEVPVISHQEAVGSSGAVLDFDIDTGMAIWGQVRYPSLASAEPFRVHVIDAHGVRSSTAETDENGFYVIRVNPGEGPFTVVCEGRDDGRDPVLRIEIDLNEMTDTAVAPEYAGQQVDFDYPTYRAAAASGRVLDEAGDPVDEVEVRFTSTDLSGYDGMDESLQITRVTDNSGNFDVSLQAGEYQVEFMPEGDLSPTLSEVSVSGNSSLGTITLEPLVPVSGMVLDSSGSAISTAAVACRETGFGGRSWTTFASKKGLYELDLPRTHLECEVTPSDTSVHAMTRVLVDGQTMDGVLDLSVSKGQLAKGIVDLAGEPEGFAVVEVRDGLERLLGSTVTDEQGEFRVRIDLPNEEETTE